MRLSLTGLRPWLFFIGTAVAISMMAPAAQGKEDWPVVSEQELRLRDEPASPGEHAIILYREQHTDDVRSSETHYLRIKILTEEGRKYADVQLPFIKGITRLRDIKARTVKPDGSAVEFKGQIYEKVLVKAGGVRLLSKTFTLPEVQVGTIIDYRYQIHWPSWMPYAPTWDIQHELFTRRARFSFRPWPGMWLQWLQAGLPPDKQVQEQKNHIFQLELERIPPFHEEPLMPPGDWYKAHVEFFYTRGADSPDEFWRELSKEYAEFAERFIGKPKAVEQVVKEVISPADPPETKLRKLYARVQEIRNLSFERPKTEKEEKEEKLKENKNASNVLKRGYGNGNEINLLFVALARAAGFGARIVMVAGRNRRPFKKSLLHEGQFSGNLVEVDLGMQKLYLDPATKYCPYGLVPWELSAAQGIRPIKEKQGDVYVKIPQPVSADAVTERRADLQLEADGTLQGEVEISFRGQEALRRRLEALDTDETERQKELESEIKGWLPGGATITLDSAQGWEGSEEPLEIVFTVRVENFSSSTARRQLFPWALFQVGREYSLQSAERRHYPVYFPYPFQERDEIQLRLPSNCQVESLPKTQNNTPFFGRYEVSFAQQSDTLSFERRLVMDGYWFNSKGAYDGLKDFLENVRSTDEQQVVLDTAETAQQL